MSFLRKLLAAKPVRTPLEFGINENIKITKIDNEPRKKDGEVKSKNTYITFSKINSSGEVIAASEFSYFNFNHENDYGLENLANQTAHLQNLADLLNPGSVIDPTDGYSDYQELKDDLHTRKGCRALEGKLWDAFEEAVGDKVGFDSPTIRLKVVTDNKGRFLQLPKEAPIAELAESDCKLVISAYELKCKDKGLEANTATADAKGGTPDEKPKAKSALKGL